MGIVQYLLVTMIWGACRVAIWRMWEGIEQAFESCIADVQLPGSPPELLMGSCIGFSPVQFFSQRGSLER